MGEGHVIKTQIIFYLGSAFEDLDTFFNYFLLQVFDGDMKKHSSGSLRRNNTLNSSKRELSRRLASDGGNRGMLHFSIQYKQDK